MTHEASMPFIYLYEDVPGIECEICAIGDIGGVGQIVRLARGGEDDAPRAADPRPACEDAVEVG